MQTAELDCNIGVDKPCKTITKQVGCGKLRVIIIEHYNGHFNQLKIPSSMSKKTPCANSWLDAMASICTFAIRRALEEDEKGNYKEFKETVLWKGIISQMTGICCNNRSRATETSCASAIGFIIKDYVKSKRKEK